MILDHFEVIFALINNFIQKEAKSALENQKLIRRFSRGHNRDYLIITLKRKIKFYMNNIKSL